jgi:hypothetical protein
MKADALPDFREAITFGLQESSWHHTVKHLIATLERGGVE